MRKVPGFDVLIDDDLVCYRYVKDKLHQCPLYVDKGGYLRLFCRTDDGRRRTITYHRCIAIAFIPNLDNKPTVDHINRNKLDNRVENLRWATLTEQEANKDRTELSRLLHGGTKGKNMVDGKHVPNDETRLHSRIHYQLTIERKHEVEKARYERNRDKRKQLASDVYKRNKLTRRRVLFADGSHHWVPTEEAIRLFEIPSKERRWISI